VDPATPPALRSKLLKFLISTLINRLNTHEIRVARCEFEVKSLDSAKYTQVVAAETPTQNSIKTLFSRRKEKQDFPPHTPKPLGRSSQDKLCVTKCSSQDKICDIKCSSQDKICDIKCSSQDKICDIKCSSQDKLCDIKCSSQDKLCVTKCSSQDKLCVTKCSSQDKLCDCKSVLPHSQ
jgi:hypothetical protein